MAKSSVQTRPSFKMFFKKTLIIAFFHTLILLVPVEHKFPGYMLAFVCLFFVLNLYKWYRPADLIFSLKTCLTQQYVLIFVSATVLISKSLLVTDVCIHFIDTY